MNYTKKAVHGTLIVFFMVGFGSIIAYFIRMVLARNLSPSEYGLFYAVFTFVAFFAFLSDFGINAALVKYIAEFKVKNQDRKIKTAIISAFFIQLFLSLIMVTIFFLISDFLAINYFRSELASLILKILCFYLIANFFYKLFRSILQGFQRMTLFSITEPLTNTISLLLIFFLMRAGFGIFSPAIAYSLAFIVMSIFLFVLSFKVFNFLKLKTTHIFEISKKLLFFGVPTLFTMFGGAIIGYTDTLMLTYFRTLKEVGVYNVVLPSALIFLFFSTSLGTILLPLISELWAKKDEKRVTEGLRLLYKYSLLLIIPLLFTIFLFSKIFINLFFGYEYVIGSLAFQILLMGVLFFSIAQINIISLLAIGKTSVVTKIILLSALLNFLINFFLIPFFGINGAALATSLSYFFVFILSISYTIKHIDLVVPFKNWIKTLISTAMFILTIIILRKVLVLNAWIELAIILIISLLVYLFFIYILKAIDLKELKRYLSLLK